MSTYGVMNITNLTKEKFFHEFNTGGSIQKVNRVTGQVYNEPEILNIEIDAGKTIALPQAAAMDAAYQMAIKLADERGITYGLYNVYTTEGEYDENSQHTKLIFEILGKTVVNYQEMTTEELIKYALERGINVEEGTPRSKVIKLLTK